MYKKYRNLLFLGLLIFCVASVFYTITEKRVAHYQTYFAILPHFSLQPTTIDRAYKNLFDTYHLSGRSLQILIISPDHFGTTTTDLTQNIVDRDFCFQNTCLPIHAIYTDNKKNIPNTWIKEHGWGAHFLFIQKYFPQAEISLITLPPRNFSNLDVLYAHLRQLEKKNNLLVIASVDFSHYIAEQWAYIHDIKSYYTLVNDLTQEAYKSVEVDCPTCLYLVNTRANNKKQYPQLLARDSSSTIEHKDLGKDNTSRAFILYTGIRSEANGITLGFFGDLMFDRGVSYKLNTPDKIQKHFQDRYQQGNTGFNPDTYVHRKGFGLDILGYNLETSYVDSICRHQTNGINLCSSGMILGLLQSLGFNTVTIANNHMRDDAREGYMQTIHNITKNDIDYAGWTHFKGINKNTVFTTTIRGIPIALHAYNLYNRFSGDMEGYCTDLMTYQRQGYKNIVSIHRGTEYQTKHNALQENIGKNLIDCGADIIIGHHPHVVQDIQRYQGKPIIYSLGNFLFDQYFSENTKKGMYVLAHIPLSGTIEIWTGEINAVP